MPAPAISSIWLFIESTAASTALRTPDSEGPPLQPASVAEMASRPAARMRLFLVMSGLLGCLAFLRMERGTACGLPDRVLPGAGHCDPGEAGSHPGSCGHARASWPSQRRAP